jgi:hypothetical protein
MALGSTSATTRYRQHLLAERLNIMFGLTTNRPTIVLVTVARLAARRGVSDFDLSWINQELTLRGNWSYL